MSLAILVAIFVFGAGLTFIPGIRKYTSFFDTLIHEVGHGIATLPFGSSVPSVTIRSTAEGEAKSSLGQLHGLLPRPIAFITEKLSRFFNVISGYSAPIILGVTFVALAFTNVHEINYWAIAALGLVAIGTILWTVVRMTDSPFLFVVSIALIVGVCLYNNMGWMTVAIVLGFMVFLVISKTVVSLLAMFCSALSVIALVMVFVQLDKIFDLDFLASQSFDVTSVELARYIVIAIVAVAILSMRSLFTVFITVLCSTVFGFMFFQQFWHVEYSLMFFGGLLFASGVRSYFELASLTFVKETVLKPVRETDMVFASQDLGGTRQFWYLFSVLFTVVSSVAIVLFLLGVI